jgi:hypothetical protein
MESVAMIPQRIMLVTMGRTNWPMLVLPLPVLTTMAAVRTK